jgi:microcystin-dependent protein
MSEPFIGQIIMFGGNFAPRGWAFCDGQLLAISSNVALFSILGTTYGGDGRTTFALPDLRSRVAVHAGTGTGLSTYRLGQRSGSETHTLDAANLPPHTHSVGIPGDESPGTTATPEVGTMPAEASEDVYGTGAAPVTTATVTSDAGPGSRQPVNHVQPYNTVHYIIALQGVYPSRS